MLRNHVLFTLGVLLIACAPAALACNCDSGDTCHCAGGCTCDPAATTAAAAAAADPMAGMTTPSDQIVALAAASPQTVHVDVLDFSFSADVTIHQGDTVQWDWVRGFHTITSVVGSQDPFDSGGQSSGSYSHTFNKAGTFVYYCQVHAIDNFDGTATGMAATVNVLPVAVPEPTTLLLLPAACGFALLPRRRHRPRRAP